MRTLRVSVVAVLLGLLSSATPADALTPITGTIVALGEFRANGLTTSPPGTTPDLANWWTWPSRGWELRSAVYPDTTGMCWSYRPPSTKDNYYLSPPTACGLLASGSMWGWCDLSKGQGTGGWGGGSTGGEFTSFRWSGVGHTLVVTGEMRSGVSNLLGGITGPPWGEARGTFVAHVTFLNGAAGVLDGCSSPGGLPYPLPVLIELEYALQ